MTTAATIMTTDATSKSGSVPAKKRKVFDDVTDEYGVSTEPAPKPIKRPCMNRAREIRLEQNLKSARESRKRKKAMLEDLQRSLVFFTKANAALRTEHEVLTRKILTAHSELRKLGLAIPEPAETEDLKPPLSSVPMSIPVVSTVMEPGSTMQAMLTFQQAAQIAIQSTTSVMQSSGMLLDTSTSS
ncbi:bZIP transcription factor [Nitzschia inconspicua]|uniref:BZIP transcription factor n=1 Tax=Nitzschia inconspicua TaxID=303405 RepID=A0A9K3PN79_9STRA|nr:bZIP transcription factor [Nitzschia inconspicua]